MTTVTEAKATLARLEANLVEATNRATELQVERRKLSFIGLTGNEAARAKLDEMSAASVTAGFEAENIRAAIDEARQRLSDAERSAALAKQRENARQAKAIITVASKRGPKMAEALRELCTEVSEFLNDMRGLDAYGAPITNIRLAELWIQRAVLPHLRNVGFDVDIIAPLQRGDLAKIGDIYLTNAAKWVEQTLGDDAAAPAEQEVA
jgi:hypothetical protein